MIKPSYLLAGSVSLLGMIAGLPAQAATEVATQEANSAALLQPQAQTSDALLALQAPSQTTETAVSAPLSLEANQTSLTAPVAPLNLAQTAPTVSPESSSIRSTAKSVDQMVSGDETMDQVTSITQLSDVKPTDWAFQALQSLVERYGCIAGYPNSTFRGQRAATRFELAAALNACMDVVSDRFATKEDLNTLRRLQQEFAKELAALKGRVTNLEARTAKLEAQQFSTTTKLQAIATMSFQAGAFGSRFNSSASDRVLAPGPGGNGFTNGVAYNTGIARPGDGPGINPTVIGAVILNLNTSFNGSDLLQTSLAFGNNGQDTIGAAGLGKTGFLGSLTPTGTSPGPYFNPGQYYWAAFTSNPILYRLSYTFKPFKDVTITAGPQFYPSDILDFNSYANAPGSDYGSYFFLNNSFIIPYAINFAGGAGAAVQWNPGGGPITVKGLYMAAGAGLAVRDSANIGSNNGFFGDPYQGTLELQYASTFGGGKNNFAVRLQYTNASVYNVTSNAIGVNVEAGFGKFGVWGRAGYAFLDGTGRVVNGFLTDPLPYADLGGAGITNSYQALTFAAGIAYKDLLVPGSMIGLGAGAPFITQNRGSARGINDRNQVNVEAFYRFPINDNISITPIFSAILNPNNSSANDTIYQGVLRTTFTF
jgi:hypothetical protein